MRWERELFKWCKTSGFSGTLGVESAIASKVERVTTDLIRWLYTRRFKIFIIINNYFFDAYVARYHVTSMPADRNEAITPKRTFATHGAHQKHPEF